MQLALNRHSLLAAVYGDNGNIENGIFPHGLYGYNPELPEIPYDPAGAKELLAQAGYPDGFDLTISINSSSTRWELSVMNLAASMWKDVGINATIDVIDESEFMSQRKSGQLACYTAQWMADFNDPDNFIYTFYGNQHNTTFRSLCYPREDIMQRIQEARAISDRDARISEYRDLERIIVQEDAAWIPLYSRQRYYVTSERLEGIQASWNGSVKNKYREMSIK
jgi:ABC-type transport system substrate-binding protein